MADPFISPLLLTITPALSSKYELPVLSSERFPLADHHGRHDFLTEFWLSFLDCGQNHVSTARSWQSVKSTSDTIHCYHIQVFTSRVVCTIHHSSHRAGQGDPELGSCCSSASSLRH